MPKIGKKFATIERAGQGVPLFLMSALQVLFPKDITSAVEVEITKEIADLGIRESCSRQDVDSLLNAAHRWTMETSWPDWEWRGLHPIVGEPTDEFWEAVAAELAVPRTVAVMGFGADSERRSRYAPYWACASRVTEGNIFFKDTPSYHRIPRRDTGVRPAGRWAVEDCFIIGRIPAARL